MKQPQIVTVTGGAGQIGYALIFRIASGQLLGKDQPVILHLLEVPAALDGLKGVAMELDDCAFPLLHKTVCTADPNVAFADANFAFLVGARPRSAGMERKDLLGANAEIFSVQGKAINAVAARDVRVLVVGNPANTNALIAMSNAPDLASNRFSAMMRLDHNRTQAQLAMKSEHLNADVRRVIVWGNHSVTQFPDIHHATIDYKPALGLIDNTWYQQEMIPRVQKRGTEVIQTRGASSAASAANAALCAMRDWQLGTSTDDGSCGEMSAILADHSADDWTSMAIFGNGEYDLGKGIFYSYPVTCANGEYRIVKDLEINEFSRAGMEKSQTELLEERDSVRHLIP